MVIWLLEGTLMDVKDQNPKAQPSTFKIRALSFWKNDIFGENPTKWKIRYFEIRPHPKKSANIC